MWAIGPGRRDFAKAPLVGADVRGGLRMQERTQGGGVVEGARAGRRSGSHMAWRIWAPIWRDEETFADLLDLLERFREAVDEVALFDDFIHSPGRSASEARIAADLLPERMATIRSRGIGAVGINVIATMGHGMQAGFRKMSFPATVGHDGTVSESCPCPRRPEFRRSIQEYYRIMAAAGPDFIWVDDDLRSVSHGVRYPCFCDYCLEAFGHGEGREDLVAALDRPANGQLRQAWSEFCGANLESLLCEIREAICSVNPDTEIGLMTIGHSQSTYGYPIPRLMVAAGAVRGRPGHGYYTDLEPGGLLNKIMNVSRQVRDYPEEVTSIQYELENWPYVTLDKSVQTVLNESTLAMAVGCTGVAFNAVSERATTFREYEPLLSAVAAERRVWDSLCDAAHGLPVVGFWPVDHDELVVRRQVGEDGWFVEGKPPYDIQEPNEIGQMGIPLTADRSAACGALLSGRLAEAFRDRELEDMLRGAVFMDDAALQVLWERGLGELAGVRPGVITAPCYERLTEHPLNGEYAGDGRRVLPSSIAVVLQPVADGVLDLAHAVGQADEADLGMCASLYENSIGGRVAVSTYVPWSHLGRAGKRHQIICVADWLCRDRLPVVIEQMVRVAPFVRRSTDGRRMVIVLLNAALDAAGPLHIRVRGWSGDLALLTKDGPRELGSERVGDETIVQLPVTPPWQTAIVVGVQG
jgi:hypothetical protein